MAKKYRVRLVLMEIVSETPIRSEPGCAQFTQVVEVPVAIGSQVFEGYTEIPPIREIRWIKGDGVQWGTFDSAELAKALAEETT